MELCGGSRHHHAHGSLAGPSPASFTPVTMISTVTSAGRFSKGLLGALGVEQLHGLGVGAGDLFVKVEAVGAARAVDLHEHAAPMTDVGAAATRRPDADSGTVSTGSSCANATGGTINC